MVQLSLRQHGLKKLSENEVSVNRISELANHSLCVFQGDEYVYMIKEGQVDEGDVEVKDEDGFGPYEVNLLSL